MKKASNERQLIYLIGLNWCGMNEVDGMEGPRAQAEKANPTPIDCWPARSAAINGIGLSFLFFFPSVHQSSFPFIQFNQRS